MGVETTVTEFEYNKKGFITKETRTTTIQENPMATLGCSSENRRWLAFIEEYFHSNTAL